MEQAAKQWLLVFQIAALALGYHDFYAETSILKSK
jgi:hypothetical protein